MALNLNADEDAFDGDGDGGTVLPVFLFSRAAVVSTDTAASSPAVPPARFLEEDAANISCMSAGTGLFSLKLCENFFRSLNIGAKSFCFCTFRASISLDTKFLNAFSTGSTRAAATAGVAAASGRVSVIPLNTRAGDDRPADEGAEAAIVSSAVDTVLTLAALPGAGFFCRSPAEAAAGGFLRVAMSAYLAPGGGLDACTRLCCCWGLPLPDRSPAAEDCLPCYREG